MPINSDYFLNFNTIDKSESYLTGEEGMILCDLARNGFLIPAGFIIPSSIYFNILNKDNLKRNIEQILSNIDYNRPDSLLTASAKIEKHFMQVNLEENFIRSLFKIYEGMGGILKYPHVKIIPSFDQSLFYKKLIPEKADIAIGEANLLLKIRKAWAKAFQPEIMYLNHGKNINSFKLGVAIIVQKMIDYDAIGYLYTKDPIADNPNKILISIGEKPAKFENYNESQLNYIEVAKHDLLITKRVNISEKWQFLDDKLILELAKLGKDVEKNLYFPKRINWVIKKRKIYIVKVDTIDIFYQTKISYQTEISKNRKSNSKLATKIYLQISNPGIINEEYVANSDGIGLIQGNSFIKKWQVHPKAVLNNHGPADVYINKIADDLDGILKQFNPKPVIYCLSDLTSNELRNLSKGKLFEPVEANPIMGFHGTYRHIHDRKILEMEIKILKYLRDKKGRKNIWLMLPFVRTPSELIEIKKIFSSHGLHRSSTFRIWLMIANIANIVSFEKFVDCGIDGISINTDYLTMLTLATDCENLEMVRAYDEINESVMTVIETAIKNANKLNIDSSIYGHILNLHPNLIEKFVSLGVNSVTILPEMIEEVKKNIEKTEIRMIQKKYYV